MALIGMDVCGKRCADLDSLARGVYAGAPLSVEGAVALAPEECLLRAAANALLDAGIERTTRVGLILAVPGDGRGVLDQVAGLHDFAIRQSGPAEAGLPAAALVSAARRLEAGDLEAVLVGAIGDEGAAAIVLAPAEKVRWAYAIIRAFGAGPAGAAADLHRAAGIQPAEIGYVEMLGGCPGLAEAYGRRGADRTTAASGFEPASWGLPGLVGLIKAAICLHRRTLPVGSPLPDPSAWEASSFYTIAESRPWLCGRGALRRAALHGRAGTEFVHLILEELPDRRDQPAVRVAPGAVEARLFLVAGHDQATLLERLDSLIQAGGVTLEVLAAQSYEYYQQEADAPYVLALVAHDGAELQREVEFARQGVVAAFATGKPWVSPAGGYFTARPLRGPVAFVYPGAFNSYVGMGRELFQHFPTLHEALAEVTSNAAAALAEPFIFPRELDAATPGAEERLAENITAVIQSGTGLAVLLTLTLREVFGVQPGAALGYSLGEASMLWATGVWRDGDGGSERWHHSPLFRTRLGGVREAVREAWDLAADEPASWIVYLLKAPAARVQEALATEPHVYLTMINAPGEVIIAGDPEGCRRVIAALGCHALRAPFDSVLHNPVTRGEYPALEELFSNPTSEVREIDFYSTASYGTLRLERRSLARAMAEMTCAPVDFPRLVQAAYAGGARIFVELGPQGTCTRWIRGILREQEHAAVAANRTGLSDFDGFLAVLAQLVSHRAPIDLSPLYAPRGENYPALPERKPGGGPQRGEIAPNGFYQPEMVAEAHGAFLEARRAAVEQTGELIRLQTATARQWLQGAVPSARPVRYTRRHLEEFASGSLVRCFGPIYQLYEGRRTPRIPNGDLLLIDRVMEIEGALGEIRSGATLVSEYDVPAGAWFYRDNAAPVVPYSVLMEIALQPCGFLSAYQGTTLPYSEVDFYFRNLDGEARLLREVDLRGRTVTNRVQLQVSTAVEGIIIQKYSFELACEGEPFYRGSSSFGYFTAAALDNQVGLDGGQAKWPWYKEQPGELTLLDLRMLRQAGAGRPHYRPAQGQLNFLDEVYFQPDGGKYGQGYIYARARVDPRAWFFACHFYQDPVMPGSLGVEAMVQAMQAYALRQDLGKGFRSPRFEQAVEHGVTWKYRGQLTPGNEALALEIHLHRPESRPEGLVLSGDASLWKNDLRIYAVDGIAIRLAEA